MNKANILVAPRELKDQVERASRVLGCEASVADRLAEDVTFCEINYGQGISSWLQIATLNSIALSEVLRSSLRLRLPTGAESLDVHFDPPVFLINKNILKHVINQLFHLLEAVAFHFCSSQNQTSKKKTIVMDL